MEKLDLEGRMERVPEFLRPNQVGPDGQRVKPSNGEIACNLIFALTIKAVAIAMVVIGAENLDNCPAEPMVPKYLIAAGSLNLINGALQLIAFLCILCWVKGFVDEGGLFLEITCVRILRGVLAFFTMIWFITGSVYVFGAHEPNYINTGLPNPNYCDETTYKFAFYTLVLAYLFMFAVTVLFCGICCCMCCCTCFGAVGAAAASAVRRSSNSSDNKEEK